MGREGVRAIRGAKESARQPEGGRAKRLGERGLTCGARRRGEGRTTPPLALRYVRRTPTHLHLTPPPQSSLGSPSLLGNPERTTSRLTGCGTGAREEARDGEFSARNQNARPFRFSHTAWGVWCLRWHFSWHQLTHSFFFSSGRVCVCVVFAVFRARRERSASAFRPPLFSPSFALSISAPGGVFRPLFAVFSCAPADARTNSGDCIGFTTLPSTKRLVSPMWGGLVRGPGDGKKELQAPTGPLLCGERKGRGEEIATTLIPCIFSKRSPPRERLGALGGGRVTTMDDTTEGVWRGGGGRKVRGEERRVGFQ